MSASTRSSEAESEPANIVCGCQQDGCVYSALSRGVFTRRRKHPGEEAECSEESGWMLQHRILSIAKSCCVYFVLIPRKAGLR